MPWHVLLALIIVPAALVALRPGPAARRAILRRLRRLRPSSTVLEWAYVAACFVLVPAAGAGVLLGFLAVFRP